MIRLATLCEELDNGLYVKTSGRVVAVQGPLVSARIPQASLGDLCLIHMRDGTTRQAQIVSFQDDLISLAPFDSVEGIHPGAAVENTGVPPKLRISNSVVGKVLDCMGNEFGKEVGQSSPGDISLDIFRSPPSALTRKEICEPLSTGVRVIDGLCSIGYGQRVGLFAGAGVGKSTLLGMISRNAQVDVTVIALVGERGREVREFIDDCLGPEGLKRAVLVVATSDESPVRRKLAAFTATSIAEHFRDQGKRVLLLVDSLTRVSRAVRDVSLAAGEMPVRQGYTSSVYTELPRLLERSGNNHLGSITAIYTVLTNGDRENDPLGEEITSILDGHIILDPRIAEQGIRPAVDAISSVSRLLPRLQSKQCLDDIRFVVRALAKLKRDRDIILFGGTPDRELKAALSIEEELRGLFDQTPDQNFGMADTREAVAKLAAKFKEGLASEPIAVTTAPPAAAAAVKSARASLLPRR